MLENEGKDVSPNNNCPKWRKMFGVNGRCVEAVASGLTAAMIGYLPAQVSKDLTIFAVVLSLAMVTCPAKLLGPSLPHKK